jgi:Outer membrane protein beta-barrel domain
MRIPSLPRPAALVPAIVCVFAGVVGTASPARAQTAGLVVGVTSGNVSMGSPSPIVAGTATETLSRYSGATMGAFFSTDQKRTVSIGVEGAYVVRGVKVETIDTATNLDFLAGYRLSYLAAPVLARVSLGRAAAVGVHLVTGPSFALRIGARETGTNTGVGDQVKRFDLGYLVGGGVDVRGYTFQVRYEWGLTNIARQGGVLGTGTMKNRTLSVVAIVPFR